MPHAQIEMVFAIASRAAVVAPTRAVSSRQVTRASAAPKNAAAAGVSLTALASVAPAHALTLQEFESGLESTADQLGKFSDAAVKTGAEVGKAATGAAEILGAASKPVVEAASPLVKTGVDKIAGVAMPAVESAKGAVGDAAKSAVSAAGVSDETLAAVQDKATAVSGTVGDKVTPIVGGAFDSAKDFIATADAETILVDSLVLGAVLLLAPPVLGAIGGAIKGYAGSVAPVDALGMIVKDNTKLIDIRDSVACATEGICSLPSGSKSNYVKSAYKKLPANERGALRDAFKVEAEIAALTIDSLKAIKKGDSLIIMDRNGDKLAELVAKSLTSLGYGPVYTLQGGFRGWKNASLGVAAEKRSFALAELVTGTTDQKFLPGN